MIKKRLTAEKRSAQIVKVAMRLFSQKGFKGTTTREIAKQAGVSEAIIFKHFAKKEELFSAIINGQCNDSEGQSFFLYKIVGEKRRGGGCGLFVFFFFF